VFAPAGAGASNVSAAGGASTYRATSPLAPNVRNLNPEPGTTVRAFFPRVSATIQTSAGSALRASSLKLFVDGKDVSGGLTFSGETLAFVPRAHLQPGWHDVFLEGSDTANHAFSEAWVFRSSDPDIDLPINDDGGFAFLPVGLHGPFTHFFLVSPFDGFGLVQLCGFEVPLTHANGTPVFFVTVPVTLGTVLLNCSPGLVFTPFQAGIGQLNPVFFPIEVAGPQFFTTAQRAHDPMITTRSTMPVYRTSTVPVYRTSTMPVYRSSTMPVYRSSTMPVYRASTMPVYRSSTMPVYRAAGLPTAGSAIIPSVSIPQPSIPH
jgi:hypothetical protein